MASLKHSMLGVLLALSLAWLAPAPSHAAGDPRCAVNLAKLPGHELAATLRQLRAFNCDAGKILDQLKAQNPEAWKLLEQSASSTADALELTVTVTGRQYAWRYRYRFQSMGDAATQDKVLACTVVGPLVVPQGQRVELVVTSDDLIHTFAVPGLRLSVDGVPGRLNTAILDTAKAGSFVGGATPQSGPRHGEMAIEVRVLEPDAYRVWKQALSAAGCATP